MNLAAVIYRRRRRRHESRERRQNDELPDICVQVTNAMGRRTGRDGEVAEGNNHETANTRMPLLYALARSWAWDAVAFRCRSHPEEAQMNWSDNHGDNILHWAAFGRPPFSPVRILLDTAPELAKVRNNKGLLPLHGMFAGYRPRPFTRDTQTSCTPLTHYFLVSSSQWRVLIEPLTM
jgi:hypothetical protein